MREIRMSGSMSGVWRRGHGRTSKAPPDERGGNGYVRPTTTAPHLDSTIALLPERGQDDIWGNEPEAVAAGSLVPRAPARRCQGGWRVSGRYSFASGCMHAQWAIIGARCEDAAGNELPRYLVIPAGEIEIVDDWHSLGMR